MPIVFFATLLPALARAPFDLVIALLRTATDAIYSRLVIARLSIDNAHRSVTDTVNFLYTLPVPDPFGWWVELVNTIQQFNDWAFSYIELFPLELQRWFDGFRSVVESEEDVFVTEWRWVVTVLTWRDAFAAFAETIGIRLDELATGVIGTILDWAEDLLSPAFRWVAGLHILLTGDPVNPWDAILATSADIWAAIGTLVALLWADFLDWLRAGLSIVGEFLYGIAEAVLDPVGSFLGNLYPLLGGLGGNPWPWIRSATPDIWTAFDSLFQALWWAFQDWLAAVLAGASDLVDGFLGLFDWLGTWIEWLQAFIDDPWEMLFSLARGKLWPIVERWLIDLWDGNDEPAPTSP